MVEDLTQQQEVEHIMSAEGGSVIVDFWSPTCGPCKRMAPDFEAVAKEFGDDPIRFVKINTADESHLSQPFHIRAVPTLLFIHNGEILDVRVGAMGGPDLVKKAKWLLKKASGEGFFSGLFGKKKASGD